MLNHENSFNTSVLVTVPQVIVFLSYRCRYRYFYSVELHKLQKSYLNAVFLNTAVTGYGEFEVIMRSDMDFAFVLWPWVADTLTPCKRTVCLVSTSLSLLGWWVVEQTERAVLGLSCSSERCRGTTKRPSMDTWSSWRRPRGKIWTRPTTMAWLQLYWLLTTDISMPFSSFAAESKCDFLFWITTAEHHKNTARPYKWI